MKAEEKRRKGLSPEKASALDGIPRDLPALMKAYKLQKKASKVGFDWDHIEGVFQKIEEELGELRQAVTEGQSDKDTALELGDLLFAVSNAARFIGADPEEALSRTNRKFVSRFSYIEATCRPGKTLQESTLDEMEALWQAAKSGSAQNGGIDV